MQVLGTVTVGLGALGLASSLSPQRLSLRTLLLVGLGFAALSAMELLEAAGRDVATHCALAEAETRIHHLEETVKK